MLSKLHPNYIKIKLLIKRLKGLNQQELFNIALKDSNVLARQTAISLLSKPEIIELLFTQLDDKQEKKIAGEHWAKLLIYQDNMPEYMAEQCVLGCENQDLLLALLKVNDNASLSTLAFTGLNSEAHLLELFSEQPSSKVASAIIYKLKETTNLKKAKQLCQNQPSLIKKIEHRISVLKEPS